MNETRRCVVVGVDGSDSAVVAVRWAATEAFRRGLTLRMINACPWSEHRGLGARGPRIDYATTFLQLADDQLAAAAQLAHAHVPGVETEQQTVVGNPVQVLQNESRDAEMLVLGSRGLGGVTDLLIGSVAMALTAHAHCPVVIARGEQPDEIHPLLPVVVGVDGSAASEGALEFAFDIAAARDVPLTAVRAWHDGHVAPRTLSSTEYDEIDAEQRVLLDEQLAGWIEKFPTVEVWPTVTRGRPAHVLLALAASAQLVAVGSRGRGGLSSLVLGSVSNALVHRSVCPVAVFRSEADAR